ncbi:MAG: hypothetical protein JKY95_17025, partial [Planctomycetaceae bacterium]|nr:hypothetical protein [Planctomycetaceae bacterium]
MNLQQWLHCETSILLSWILLHSLWQLASLGLIAAIIRAIVPMKSQTRYAFSYVMLLCMAAAPLGTLLFIPAPTAPIAASVVVESPQPELIAEANVVADSPKEITLPATEMPLINRPLPPASTLVAPSITAILPQTEPVQQAQQPGNTADFKMLLIEYSVWLTPFWL